METIVIDANNFILGASLNDNSQNGAYSPKSKGINHLYSQGKLYFQPAETDLSSSLEGNFIASTPDPTLGGNDAYILDDEGKFYTLNGSTLTKRQTDGAGSYVFGTADMVNFNGEVFATSAQNVIRLTGTDLSTIDATWWTVTRGHSSLTNNARHPLLVVEDTMYIADANLLHTWDGTTSVPSALVLPNIWSITAMVKHPNGRDIIAFCTNTADYSHTRGGRAVAFIINTVTLEFTQEIPIDSQVEGARLVGGILYVMYGKNLGYFTDSGVVFLRRLEDIALQGGRLGYKHHLGEMEGHLLVVEKDNVLAYGDLGAGKVFWYPLNNKQNAGQNIDAIAVIGTGKLIYGTQSSGGVEKLYKLDYYDNTGNTVSTRLYTNRYSFPRKVWVRRIEVQHDTFSASGAGLEIYNVLMSGSVEQVGVHSYTLDGGVNASRYDTNIYTDNLQLYFSWLNIVQGISKIIIYYEPAET